MCAYEYVSMYSYFMQIYVVHTMPAHSPAEEYTDHFKNMGYMLGDVYYGNNHPEGEL